MHTHLPCEADNYFGVIACGKNLKCCMHIYTHHLHMHIHTHDLHMYVARHSCLAE